MIDRRKFIKSISALGISLPALQSNLLAKTVKSTKNNPVLLCSRGEKWGKKVLRPGWDVLRKNGSLLDAIELSANVTELDPDDTSVGYGGLPNMNGVVQRQRLILRHVKIELKPKLKQLDWVK